MSVERGSDPLEPIHWYIECLRSVAAEQEARGLAEAREGYVYTLSRLRKAVEALREIERAADRRLTEGVERPLGVLWVRDRARKGLGDLGEQHP